MSWDFSLECLGWQLGRCGEWEDAKRQVGLEYGEWFVLVYFSWFLCLHPLNIHAMFFECVTKDDTNF